MIFTYHQIESQYSPHVYGVTAGTLREHLRAFRLYSSGSGHPIDHTVTFDDGHVSNYEQALPLLTEAHLRAVFFIPVGFVQARTEVMTWSQLRQLVASGHEIASHSVSHAMLTECDDAKLRDELVCSRQSLEDRIGIAVGAISMPHGRWDRRVIDACHKAGYCRVYTSDFWRPTRSTNNTQVIGRLTVRRTMTAAYITSVLHASRMGMCKSAAPHVVKNWVRGMLGNDLYYQLWRRLYSGCGEDRT